VQFERPWRFPGGKFLDRETDTGTPVLLNWLIVIDTRTDELYVQQRFILGMIESKGVLKGSMKSLRAHLEHGRKAEITAENYRSVSGDFPACWRSEAQY